MFITALSQTALSQTALSQTALSQTALSQTALSQTALSQTALYHKIVFGTTQGHTPEYQALPSPRDSGWGSYLKKHTGRKD